METERLWTAEAVHEALENFVVAMLRSPAAGRILRAHCLEAATDESRETGGPLGVGSPRVIEDGGDDVDQGTDQGG